MYEQGDDVRGEHKLAADGRLVGSCWRASLLQLLAIKSLYMQTPQSMPWEGLALYVDPPVHAHVHHPSTRLLNTPEAGQQLV